MKRTAISWGLTLGLVGFIFGLFGPLLLNPNLKRGYLLGFVLPGPASLIVGALFGFIAGRLEINKKHRYYLLGLASFLVAIVTLLLSLPEPRKVGYVLEAEIQGCKDPIEFVPISSHLWRWGLSSGSNWKQPLSEWNSRINKMLENDKGVVLIVHVVREKELYESQLPWMKGQPKASAWHSVNTTKSYFARFHGNDCAAYTTGDKQLYFPEREQSQVSPPDILPTFLILDVLKGIPDKYKELISK